MLNIAFMPASEESMYTELDISANWSKTYDFSTYKNKDICMKFITQWKDWHVVDCFLCTNHYDWQDKWIKRIYELHMESKLVYHMTEPETVMPLHSKAGVNRILKYFHYILSWNLDLVDEKRIFFCLPMSYNFNGTVLKKKLPFSEKKLLVNMSGNKRSVSSRELYSERRKVIDYCERHCLEDFDLFGPGWGGESLQCYRGICDNKYVTYQNYKFALCLENECGATYITEKILDCLVGGIVPIYYGAPNIIEYIPQTCFISYEQFAGVAELISFLKHMTYEEYLGYLLAAESWLGSDKVKKFEIESLAKDIECVVDRCKVYRDEFRVKRSDLVMGRISRYCCGSGDNLKNILNRLRYHT